MFAHRYFRHWLNLVILWSAWTEFDLIPYVTASLAREHLLTLKYREASKQWSPPDGAWLTWWMKYQIVFPIAALQVLNLFWYYLIWRILIRLVELPQWIRSVLMNFYRAFGSGVDDVRSDDEDDGDDNKEDFKENWVQELYFPVHLKWIPTNSMDRRNGGYSKPGRYIMHIILKLTTQYIF